MASITINGVTFSGNNISITGNKVVIDGQDRTPDSKNIAIEVNGNVDNLSCDACDKISISGNVGDVQTASGDVRCGNVSGNVATMSGDVNCGEVAGNVKTMSGDIVKQVGRKP